jgi:clan AA aspartic protease
MTGIVNADLAAVLTLRVLDASGHPHDVDAVIDTGFNGYLTLPPALAAGLGLQWLCRQQGQLADGSLQTFDVYVGTVEWHGQPQAVEVDAANAQPLLGMALLEGSELRIEVRSGSPLTINILP